jgi:cation diffusion facilitator CzcD-associated flavoprotein CzcO
VVTYLNGSTNRQETLVTDYVVISTGLYAAPKLPEYKVSLQSQQSSQHACPADEQHHLATSIYMVPPPRPSLACP